MRVDVHIPPGRVVVLKKVVQAYLGAQLVQNPILEACSDTHALDFAAIYQIGSYGGFALLYLGHSRAHAQHKRAY